MPADLDNGRRFEDQAAAYLQGLGYTLVKRRFRFRRGEIDIVALEGDLLVFVEVKSNAAPGYIPEAAIGDGKRRALVRAANAYLAYVEEPLRPFRFDLVAIDKHGLRHYRDFMNENADFDSRADQVPPVAGYVESPDVRAGEPNRPPSH